MSKKGTKLSEESRAAIGAANGKKATLEISLRGDRLYLRALGHNSISVEVDVTPVWHFFKEATGHTTTTAIPLEEDRPMTEGEAEIAAGLDALFEKDPLFDEAVEAVRTHRRASTGLLQRVLGIGYVKSSTLIDQLELAGIISPKDGVKPRKVL